MAANAELNERFDVGIDELVDAVDRALDDVQAKCIQWSRSRRRVTAQIGVHILFWGENLSVEIDPKGEVWVRSESAFPTIILDGGTNRRRCRAVLDAIADRLGLE
ncbi:MAG TPA: hypothetical protein VHR66_32230 [Gemmataceae bacterium]|nr:hypothetical protein [Gemmataceae bacterium]